MNTFQLLYCCLIFVVRGLEGRKFFFAANIMLHQDNDFAVSPRLGPYRLPGRNTLTVRLTRLTPTLYSLLLSLLVYN